MQQEAVESESALLHNRFSSKLYLSLPLTSFFNTLALDLLRSLPPFPSPPHPTDCPRFSIFLDSTASKASHPSVFSMIQGCSLPSGNFPLSSESPPRWPTPSPHAGQALGGQSACAGPSSAGPGVPAPKSPRARCRLGEHGRFRSRTVAGARLTTAEVLCAPTCASLTRGRRRCSGLLFSRHGEELELRESRRSAPGGTATQRGLTVQVGTEAGAGGRRGEASGGWQRGRGRGRDGKGRVVRGRRGRCPEEVEAADSRCGDGEPERAVAPPQGPRCEGENAVSLWPLPFLSLLTFRSSRLLQLCLRTQRFYFNRRSVVKGLVFSLFCPPCH